MRRDELVELAKLHGIDLTQLPAELTDENLEAVVGGLQNSGALSANKAGGNQRVRSRTRR